LALRLPEATVALCEEFANYIHGLLEVGEAEF
jgi:hypothetical protein